MTKSERVTNLLDSMDTESMYRMNRGCLLYETSAADIQTIERYFAACKAARLQATFNQLLTA